MPRPKAPAWTSEERAILNDVYPREGISGACDALPDRSWRAIYVMAAKLGIRSSAPPPRREAKLVGARLAEAVALRDESNWGFARIGAHFGVSESAACNAIVIAQCTARGYRPAERDASGRLLPEGIERLRFALRKGYKGIDIQLRLGLSAGRVAEERRRYNRELKARDKAPLPAPGAGEPYSGVKISKDKRQEVEVLFLEGLGAQKINERTGVSHTSIGRIRNRLVQRLRRKGQSLPGCDLDGVRHNQADSRRWIAPEQKAALRQKLLDGMPVRRAAKLCGIGQSSAYFIRDALKAELEAEGGHLPAPKRPGRLTPSAVRFRATEGIPRDKLFRFRELVREHGQEEARLILAREIAADRARPLTFEEQLARVRAGAALAEKFEPRRRDPDMTLGGVATGAL
jgi:DNA invertase Pin-like site-specific DNA recombinase